MSPHDLPHPLAGRRARIVAGHYEGALGRVVDWYDREAGRRWSEAGDDPLAHAFAFRAAYERTPCDDEVVLVNLHTGPALVHVEQLDGGSC